jgi:hypothetical protein
MLPPTYKVSRMSVGQIDASHCLVSLIAPELDLEEWRTVCRNLLDCKDDQFDQDDIAVATNTRGYVQGLCVSGARKHWVDGRILDVPIFVAASAADADGVAIDLLYYLKRLAKTKACDRIRISTSGRDSWRRYFEAQEIAHSDHGTIIVLDATKRDFSDWIAPGDSIII